jgi:hypothetical protein
MLISNKNQKISEDERMTREQLLLHPGPDTRDWLDIAAPPFWLSLFILLCLFMKMNEVPTTAVNADQSPGTLAADRWGSVAAERDRTRGGTSGGGHVTVEGQVTVTNT